MTAESLKIEGAMLIKPDVFRDARGFFMESWSKKAFAGIGLDFDFVQDDHSRSSKHVLRGLHYQVAPYAQGKLAWVSSGTVFDVIVDLRANSTTFGEWDGRLLTSEGHEQLWAPPGCAHGFLVLSDFADFHYKCTSCYSPAHERGMLWDSAGISWPLPSGIAPIMAEKDRTAPPFNKCQTI